MLAVRTEPVIARGGPPLPPETKEAREKRQRLRARMRELGMSVPHVSALLHVNPRTLRLLLDGETRTSRSLGYDRWPERVSDLLDARERALAIMHLRAPEIAAEIEAEGLPLPPELQACMPGKTRSRRAAR